MRHIGQENGSIFLCIHNFETGWSCEESFTPWPLFPQKRIHDKPVLETVWIQDTV
jgi:hypothetical protein